MNRIFRTLLFVLPLIASTPCASWAQPGAALVMRPDKTGQETCDAFRQYRHEASQLVTKGVRGCAGFSEVPTHGETAASTECRKVVLQTILDHLARQEAPGSGGGGGGEYTLSDLERVCPNLWR